MSRLDKFREILSIGSAIGKPFIPGAIGNVLDAVNKSIKDERDPANIAALTELAITNDAQAAAILALNARLKIVEAK